MVMNNFATTSATRVVSWFLAISLLAAAGLASLYFTILQPEPTKEIIKDSGAYSSLSKTAITTVTNQKNEVISIPLADPAIQNILGQVFTPELLQKNAEQFIDNGYKWLNGDTKTLPLTLDLEQNKQDFVTKTGDYIQARLSSLPPCSTRAQIAANTDVFVSSCLPPGVDVAQQRAALEAQLSGNEKLPSVLGIDGAAAGKTETTQTVLDATSQLPKSYQRIKLSFFVFVVASLALTITAWLLARGSGESLSVLSKIYLRTGILVIVLGVVFVILLPHIANGVNLETSQAADTVILPIIKSLISAMGRIYLILGVGYAALGGIALAWQKRISS